MCSQTSCVHIIILCLTHYQTSLSSSPNNSCLPTQPRVGILPFCSTLYIFLLHPFLHPPPTPNPDVIALYHLLLATLNFQHIFVFHLLNSACRSLAHTSTVFAPKSPNGISECIITYMICNLAPKM